MLCDEHQQEQKSVSIPNQTISREKYLHSRPITYQGSRAKMN
ncbi:unnamed protein product [Cuscuta epithymum]|uniref:Uncharacterized protein n=1 Tax=Cuscuta epithymum TaxID=186058 RepID=A0AAV0FAR7_9ASTE|nr:unnamed protein product [Cuscuta epithymum]